MFAAWVCSCVCVCVCALCPLSYVMNTTTCLHLYSWIGQYMLSWHVSIHISGIELLLCAHVRGGAGRDVFGESLTCWVRRFRDRSSLASGICPRLSCKTLVSSTVYCWVWALVLVCLLWYYVVWLSMRCQNARKLTTRVSAGGIMLWWSAFRLLEMKAGCTFGLAVLSTVSKPCMNPKLRSSNTSSGSTRINQVQTGLNKDPSGRGTGDVWGCGAPGLFGP